MRCTVFQTWALPILSEGPLDSAQLGSTALAEYNRPTWRYLPTAFVRASDRNNMAEGGKQGLSEVPGWTVSVLLILLVGASLVFKWLLHILQVYWEKRKKR